MGVFATRSPFRPNGLGLSCLKLEKIEYNERDGYTLTVSGADMVDGTPIYDIKPYLAFTDSVPYARGGFTEDLGLEDLSVTVDTPFPESFPKEKIDTLCRILAEDPRPSYIEDTDRVYGFFFCDHEIKFKVKDKFLTVISVEKRIL